MTSPTPPRAQYTSSVGGGSGSGGSILSTSSGDLSPQLSKSANIPLITINNSNNNNNNNNSPNNKSPNIKDTNNNSNSPYDKKYHTIKVGYALRRKGEVVYTWHRVRLLLTERELVISTVSERDFMLVGHMIDILSGSKYANNETQLRYDLEEVDFHFFSFYFTWSVTGKKYGFQFDVLSENRNVNKSFCFCFDTEEEQDEWERAFRRVEGRIRTFKQLHLTEANAKRREAVHNNISTLILIAKNYKEDHPEGKPVPSVVTVAPEEEQAALDNTDAQSIGNSSLDPPSSPPLPSSPSPEHDLPKEEVESGPSSPIIMSPLISPSSPPWQNSYYFTDKETYKYYRVAPSEEVELAASINNSHAADYAVIDEPYYFRATEDAVNGAGAMKDFLLNTSPPTELGDFNRRFQDAVKGISVSRRLHITGQDLVKPYLNLIHISQDFVHTATTYGKIIINEVYLPPEKKKIKPIDVGGLAGGLKFIVQNILFKFAIDYFDLYGSDEAAAKVAGHDLRGLTHYFECGIEDLCVPLTMLLDYRGFRLICQAVMPISQDTICYGSSDGGEHVFCSDIELYEKLCRAAKMLNLKPHLCRNSKETMLVSAIDLEGHLGKDKRYYLCDFSRIFPPERPNPHIRASYMYRLFRPEFLRTLATPLCSDAFSWFIQQTPQEKEHNHEVSLATHYLLNTTIPAFAVVLIKLVAEAATKGEVDTFRVTPHIHSNGINIRHIGHLIHLTRKQTELSHTDTTVFILHIEMVARILKFLIRVKLRTKMQEIRLPLEEPYRCLLVDFLNLVFGQSEDSTEFWNTTIKSYLQSKFCYNINTVDLKVALFSMWSGGEIGLQLCFKRLLEMTNMKFSLRLLEQFSKQPAIFFSKKHIIHETDLLKIGFTTKQMNVVDFAQGFVLKARGDEYLQIDDRATAKHFFNLALQKYQDSLHANPYNKWTLVNTAEVLTRLLELEENSSVKGEEDRMLAVGRINKMYMRAINLDQNDSYSLYSYAKFLERHSDNSVTVIEEFYLRSLENDPANCLCLSSYAQFLLKNNYPDFDPFKKLEAQLSSQLTQVKDLYSTLNKCRLDRADLQIWHASSRKMVKSDIMTSTRDKYLSHHRVSTRDLPNIQKCTKCGVAFTPQDNHGGQCTHIGTWHSSFLDCNLDCVFCLSKNFSFGIPHWSCCFSFNGTTTTCCRSFPHQGPESSLRILMDEEG